MKKKVVFALILIIVLVSVVGIYFLYPHPLEIRVSDIRINYINNEDDKDLSYWLVGVDIEVKNPNLWEYRTDGCFFGEKSDIIDDDYLEVLVHPYPLEPRKKVFGDDYATTSCQYQFSIFPKHGEELTEDYILSELAKTTIILGNHNMGYFDGYSVHKPKPISNEVYLKVDKASNKSLD